MPAKLKSDVLRGILSKKGWSQNELAEKLHTSSGYISQVVKGKRNFAHNKRDKLLKILRCKYDDLFVITPRKERIQSLSSS